MASMTTTFKDGSQVEVGMFGHESVIGISALMGTQTSLNRIYTQIAGRGYSCTVADGRREFKLGGEFQDLALRYVQAQLVQAMQAAGCNAKHSVDQRLARWLLLCADRAGSDTYKMSHEFLANMLGSTRPTVSLTAAILKEQGLIRYSWTCRGWRRGRASAMRLFANIWILILDRLATFGLGWREFICYGNVKAPPFCHAVFTKIHCPLAEWRCRGRNLTSAALSAVRRTSEPTCVCPGR
jgi:hypothetical protein